MSSKIVEIDGFFVEISEEEVEFAQSSENLAQGDELVGGIKEKLSKKLQEIDLKNTIKNVCSYIKDSFNDINHPDELSLEFSVKFSGEMGIPYLSKASGESSVLVKAVWKKSSDTSASPS